MKSLIKNGRVIDPASGIDETLDILIDKKKIVEIKTTIHDPDARVIEASRLVVVPGLIDMHVHLREPGYEHKETISSGGRAAARGGFTSVACMPNTLPVNDNRSVTLSILEEARQRSPVNVFPIAAVTMGSKGEDLTEMAELHEAGAIAFSDDGHPVADSLVMRRALEYAQGLGRPVIDHCEDPSLSGDGVANEGSHAYRLGLQGIPASAEEVMVARDCILAEQAGASLHLAHLSTRGSMELLRRAKHSNIRISAEVTPHHLILDDSLLEGFDGNLKVNPPIRSREDVEALAAAVQDGTVDVIATDHAPHTLDEKTVEFNLAPFGINGLETAVPLILDRFVQSDRISLPRFVELMSTNPARILGLESKGRIAVGADADLTILNLRRERVVSVDNFLSKSRNSPFNGWKLKGAPVITIVAGKIVFKD